MRNLGDYEILELIGTGGMSRVYLGYQPKLRRSVAVKVLLPDLAQQSAYAERFHVEASTVASLQHSHIVPVYDYGVVEETSYFVMPFLSGGTLIERIQRKPSSGGQLVELPDIARFLKQISEALAYAHGKGIIHRDIKPSNIIFDTHGAPFLGDFGISCLIESTAKALDATDVIMGTYAYMSPELWNGLPPTPLVDQYALALVIYSLVTGHPAFGAEVSALGELVHKHAYEMPVPVHYLRREASPALSQVIEKAIAKNPTDRYSSVLVFAEAFEKAVHSNFEDKSYSFSSKERSKEHRLAPVDSGPVKAAERLPSNENWASMPTRIAGIGMRTRITRTSLSEIGSHNEKIFVSYRQGDSADITGRICDRLASQFGKDLIFRDLESIPLGTNFKHYLENVVHRCLVEIVVIGQKWLEVVDDLGRRLDNPDDPVRVEIEAALKVDIPIIPLLVHDAMMPHKDQLPTSIGELVYCYGIPIRADPDFNADMERLIKALERLINPPKK